jgi:hypothetical protein
VGTKLTEGVAALHEKNGTVLVQMSESGKYRCFAKLYSIDRSAK